MFACVCLKTIVNMMEQLQSLRLGAIGHSE